MKTCLSCGTPLKTENAKFCHKCGQPVAEIPIYSNTMIPHSESDPHSPPPPYTPAGAVPDDNPQTVPGPYDANTQAPPPFTVQIPEEYFQDRQKTYEEPPHTWEEDCEEPQSHDYPPQTNRKKNILPLVCILIIGIIAGASGVFFFGDRLLALFTNTDQSGSVSGNALDEQSGSLPSEYFNENKPASSLAQDGSRASSIPNTPPKEPEISAPTAPPAEPVGDEPPFAPYMLAYYNSYLQAINAQDAALLVSCTEKQREFAASRISNPLNSKNLFRFTEISIDLSTLEYSNREDGSPAIKILIGLRYDYVPRDSQDEWLEGGNIQWCEFVEDEYGQWSCDLTEIKDGEELSSNIIVIK